MMRLLEASFPLRIPRTDTIIEALLHIWIQRFHPFRISTDPPIPVDFHDSSQLTVCRRMEAMIGRSNGNFGPEILMPFFVLAYFKFRLTQCPFQSRKKMRNSLRIIPYMRTTSVTTSRIVVTPFPCPKPPIGYT